MNMMIRLICVLASFYLIILCAPGTFGDERIYDFDERIYDFNNADAADAWEPIEAEWEIIDGEYVVTHSGEKAGIAVLKEAEGIDTSDVESIELMGYDLGTGRWQNTFIVFGFDERNPVTYAIGPCVGAAQAWRLCPVDSKTRVWPGKTTLVEHKERLVSRKWYHVKLVFDGDTIILYGAEGEDDLKEKLRYNFPGGRPSGRIGVGGIGGDAKFDDFKVTFKSLDADPGGQAVVEPEDKLPVAWGKVKAGSGS